MLASSGKSAWQTTYCVLSWTFREYREKDGQWESPSVIVCSESCGRISGAAFQVKCTPF
jgi:hypothetical protein